MHINIMVSTKREFTFRWVNYIIHEGDEWEHYRSKLFFGIGWIEFGFTLPKEKADEQKAKQRSENTRASS